MRGLACLLVVAASATAGAHPARRAPPPGDLLDMPALQPPDPCGAGRTWRQVNDCLKKQGATKVVYDTPTLKIVQIPLGSAALTSRMWMFIQTDKKTWIRTQFTGYTNPQTELLGIVPFSAEVGAGVRVELGNTMRTAISIGQATAARGILRRVNTTVCLPTAWTCRTFTTACDAYVQGHLVWSFQTQIVWKPSIGLRLRGDTSHAGGTCMPVRSMLDETE